MRQVLLYDPAREPAEWTALIQPGQCAVFLSDAESSAAVNLDSSPLASASGNFCLVCDSLIEAEEYCRTAIEKFPRLKCEVFDSGGRMNPPMRVFVDPAFAHTLESPAGARRLFLLGFLALGISPALFWLGYKSQWDGSWLWVMLGINAVVVGLRLIYWGHGVKELLRRQAEAGSRLQQSAKQGAP